MLKTIVIYFIFGVTFQYTFLEAQRTYENLEEALREPEKVEELYLSDNSLSKLPPEIGKLTRLQVLALECISLIELPIEIEKFTCLQRLGLGNNPKLNFAQTFLRISSIRSLKELSLQHNQITDLPPEIGKLSVLP
ncbi:MAG: leucine-rich repeat domain-containing protein, partial [Spirochaetota bacterium]